MEGSLKVGDKVPDFETDAYLPDGNKFDTVKLSNYEGKWVVLLTYPADFTFVCPTELEDAAEFHEKFKNLGAEILSLSTDTHFVHKAWHDASSAIAKVKYPMLGDPAGKVTRLFGTHLEDSGLSLRGTFIIDPDGCLISADIHSNDIGRNIEEIHRKLQAAKYVSDNEGKVCPARWKPGEADLKPSLELVGKI